MKKLTPRQKQVLADYSIDGWQWVFGVDNDVAMRLVDMNLLSYDAASGKVKKYTGIENGPYTFIMAIGHRKQTSLPVETVKFEVDKIKNYTKIYDSTLREYAKKKGFSLSHLFVDVSAIR